MKVALVNSSLGVSSLDFLGASPAFDESPGFRPKSFPGGLCELLILRAAAAMLCRNTSALCALNQFSVVQLQNLLSKPISSNSRSPNCDPRSLNELRI